MSGKRGRWRLVSRLFQLTAHFLPLTGCAVTPLSNRIAVGQEAFVIGVGEGADSMTDLYAAPAAGGTFVRLTFTRAAEQLPRLAPSGTAVAFVRHESGADSTRWSVVILDLRSNVERSARLPPGSAPPTRIGWNPDETGVVVQAGGYLTLPAEGARTLSPVPLSRFPSADSMTGELLGDPPAAMVRECANGELCIAAASGEVGLLAAGAGGAIRWGGDSIGYFTARGFEVRPLAGGNSRHPDWSGKPSRLRNLTHHPGMPSR